MAGKEWHNTIDVGPITEELERAGWRVIDYGVELVAKTSDARIPRDTARTARSQTTRRAGLKGAVGYKSSKAVPLHEKLNERHTKGRAKFLESALVDSTAAIRRRAVQEFRAALGGK